MDRDLSKKVKRLERGVEVLDEERMHGRQAAQAIESNEILADLDEEAATLRRRVRAAKIRAAVVYGLAVAVLIVRLIVWR